MRIKVVASASFVPKLFAFVFSVLNFVFLTTPLSTTSLNFFKSSKPSTFAFKLFKLFETLANLLMPSLST